ncbi:MAG: response regulator [Rhodospirillales bacterium]
MPPGMRILIAEDEALVAMMIEDIVIDLGCAVIGPAGTVARALSLIDSEAPDGALVDLNLGGEHAGPIAAALKARNIPFIFVSGYGRTMADGANADVPIVSKPFDERDLRRAIATIAAARG